jgi:type I restriction enzyme S subunit
VKFPAYPRTKPSGVDWLGDVPEHWEVKRLKYSATINDDALPETTASDFEFKYVDIGGVNAVDGVTSTEQLFFENAPSRARRKVQHGDTIVSTVRTYLRAIAPIRTHRRTLLFLPASRSFARAK